MREEHRTIKKDCSLNHSWFTLGDSYLLWELSFPTYITGEAEVQNVWSGQEPGSGAQLPGFESPPDDPGSLHCTVWISSSVKQGRCEDECVDIFAARWQWGVMSTVWVLALLTRMFFEVPSDSQFFISASSDLLWPQIFRERPIFILFYNMKVTANILFKENKRYFSGFSLQ